MGLPTRIIVTVLFYLPPTDVLAQESERRLDNPIDSLTTRNLTQTHFERNINTFNWDMRAYYENTWRDWSLKLSELYSSTLIKTDKKFIKDQQSLWILSWKSNICTSESQVAGIFCHLLRR